MSEIYHRIYLIMIFAIMVNVPLSIAVGQGGNRHMTEQDLGLIMLYIIVDGAWSTSFTMIIF